MRAQGEVVIMHIYDAGGEIDLNKVKKIFGVSPKFATLKFESVAPEYITVTPHPLAVDLKKQKVKIFNRERDLTIQTRIYSIGAISVVLRIPFSENLAGLIRYAKSFEINGKNIKDFTKEIFREILDDIKASITETYPLTEIAEEYTVFCIKKPVMKAETFLSKNRKIISGILREEKKFYKLYEKEIEDATKHHLSYFDNNMIIIDWSAALILEPSGLYEDYLMTIELANLQLLELRTYDNLIDDKLDKAWEDMERAGKTLSILLPYKKVSFEIASMHAEMTKYIEDTINITKFFGDWTLAKIYDMLEQRLHIKEWYAAVDEKLSTLYEFYNITTNHIEAQRSTLLEVLIVLLIVFEIILALGGVW